MKHAPSHILLEVCVGSVADVEAALAAGADRLELCSALELGGLTPSTALVEATLSVSPVPIVVMVRPRAGGFCYDDHEFKMMLRDACRFLEMGASGIVFGILDRQGRIDRPRSQDLIHLADSFETVFHRAFDFVRDRRSAIDQLAEMECSRILTSGGKHNAHAGASALRALITYAGRRIEILPAGGINAENAAEIVRIAGCNQVHIGASMPQDDGSIDDTGGVQLCDSRFMKGTSYRGVAADAVSATVAALQVFKT
jgi:copper homeostasis protein